MPSIAGGRPASCTTAVPSLMRFVHRGDGGEGRHRVRPVGLGGPHGMEAEVFGPLDQFVRHLHGGGAEEVESQTQFQHAATLPEIGKGLTFPGLT